MLLDKHLITCTVGIENICSATSSLIPFHCVYFTAVNNYIFISLGSKKVANIQHHSITDGRPAEQECKCYANAVFFNTRTLHTPLYHILQCNLQKNKLLVNSNDKFEHNSRTNSCSRQTFLAEKLSRF